MSAKKYFWIRKNGNFGKGIKFGDPMPPLDTEMEKHLLNLGYIDTKQHETFDSAQSSAFEKIKKINAELVAENDSLRKKSKLLNLDNDGLISENVELKNRLSKLSGLESENAELKIKVSELEAETEDIPKNVREANKEIKKLQKQLDELTDPKGK